MNGNTENTFCIDSDYVASFISVKEVHDIPYGYHKLNIIWCETYPLESTILSHGYIDVNSAMENGDNPSNIRSFWSYLVDLPIQDWSHSSHLTWNPSYNIMAQLY